MNAHQVKCVSQTRQVTRPSANMVTKEAPYLDLRSAGECLKARGQSYQYQGASLYFIIMR